MSLGGVFVLSVAWTTWHEAFFFTIWRWDFPRSAGVRGGQGKILGSVGPQHNMTRSSFDIVVHAWGHVEP